MNHTLVIAEPGCTAEGNYGDFIELIHRAHEAGADVFKVQWTSNPEQMCERRHITPDHPKRDYYLRAYSWLAFPVQWHAEFKAECDKFGLQYAATSFLPQDVWTVDPFVAFHKVASFEADTSVERSATVTRKPVVVSTGMESRLPGWLAPVPLCEGRLVESVHYLHCVSAYPAPVDDINLSLFHTNKFSGYSDHSRDIDMGGFAVCAGAKIIEAHLRLYDCAPENPDYAAAFDPGEFAMYVTKIRKAERALGSGVKSVQPSEQWALEYKVK
jgi:sialic acid synthase SpsE